MTTPYVGEIRMFGGTFAPNGWMFCDGSLLPISENDVLFILIGTTYGGDGQETFALPDLRGRVPLHQGQGPGLTQRQLGEKSGTESVTLIGSQIPTHNHTPTCSSNAGNSAAPGNNVWAANSNTAALQFTTSTASPVNMSPASVGTVGGSQPHENRIPFQAVNYIISLFGVFPSQS